MKRILVVATLVLAASPTLSQRYESGTPEARSAALVAAIGFVRKSCPTLEIDLDVAARAGTATDINPPERVLNVARSDTVAELLAAYDRDPKNACNALWLDYGPSGRSVRGMIYRRQQAHAPGAVLQGVAPATCSWWRKACEGQQAGLLVRLLDTKHEARQVELTAVAPDWTVADMRREVYTAQLQRARGAAMGDDMVAVLLALATENAELRDQLATTQDMLVESAIDAGNLHALIEALQIERDAWQAEAEALRAHKMRSA